jgi:hypothetical protein
MYPVEIIDDRQRLRQHLAVVEHERRHTSLDVDRLEFGAVLAAAILGQMDRHDLIIEPLQIERDANAVSRRRAEVRIEFHG